MSKQNSPIMQTWRKLSVVLSLAILLFPQGILAGSIPSPSNEVAALVRVDLSSETQLRELAAFKPMVYAKLYTPQGGVILIISAGSNQRNELRGRGYAPQILDANLEGASYYLLYGLPENLRNAMSHIQILVVEGRQAVARVTPEQLSSLTDLGIMSVPLNPSLLIVPQEVETAALPSSVTPYPTVQEMINSVNSSTLYNYVGNLSGEWSVPINGNAYTISTRYTYTDVPIKKATRFAYEHFFSLGLPTGYDYYSISGYEKRSVIAEQPGLTQPQRIFLLTAHLDSTSHLNGNPYTYAPGADDNASGSAGLMLIAKILSQYEFGCTLRYALFTGEEQGYYGSKAYAADVHAQDEGVEAVLNLDMLGYNTPGSQPVMELHTRPGNNRDLAIAHLFTNVVSAYNLNLKPEILQDGLSFSDHASFWEYGYPAILSMEDWSDHTPYYHQTGDQLETLHLAYYTQFVKAAIATFAHMGCLLEGKLSGVVTDALSGEPIPNGTVEIKQAGETVETTNTQPDGTYQLSLPPGTYEVLAAAPGYQTETIQDVQIIPYQINNIDISLESCQGILNPFFNYNPQAPKVGENISFSGMVEAGSSPITYTWSFGDGSINSGQTVTHAYQSSGNYPVIMIVENSCSITQTESSINVGYGLQYLPLIINAPPP